MTRWFRERQPRTRAVLYVGAAVFAFALAVGIGAVGSLALRGDLDLPEIGEPRREQPRPAEVQRGSPGGRREQGRTAGQERAEYVGGIGEIQAEAVEAFSDSHDKLLRYDALTAEDVEEMRANEEALRELAARVDGLDPPRNYDAQYDAFRSAVDELHEAAALAHSLAADPTAATQADFEEYDRHVDEASAGLERSNDALGRGYEGIEDVREVGVP